MRCRSCHAGVTSAHRFCPACGELSPARPTPTEDDAPLRDLAPEVTPLVQERARFGAELERLATQGALRELTPIERQQWEQSYTRWRDVSFEIALLVDRVHPRSDTDRRAQPTAAAPAVDRRSREDRRDPFWGLAP